MTDTVIAYEDRGSETARHAGQRNRVRLTICLRLAVVHMLAHVSYYRLTLCVSVPFVCNRAVRRFVGAAAADFC